MPSIFAISNPAVQSLSLIQIVLNVYHNHLILMREVTTKLNLLVAESDFD